MRREALVFLVFTITLILCTPAARGITIVGSRHDLSTGSTNEPCAFCHTPHFANTTAAPPLWNRAVDQTKTYNMYDSPTLDSKTPAKPSGVSLACLGCHDGVTGSQVLYGNTVWDKHDLVNAPGPGGMPDTTSYPNCERCHGQMYHGRPFKKLGTDLRNDHPVSMTYPTAAQDSAFHAPPDALKGWGNLPLYSGKVECSTCHNVHDPFITPFLRTANTASALCKTCHIK
jgi:hypothetical protein